jgi:membrane protein YqaA with SNARE-associated domain
MTEKLGKKESTQLSENVSISNNCMDSKKPEADKKKSNIVILIATLTVMLTSMIVAGYYKEEIGQFGVELIAKYGQNWVDCILFVLSAISSTPLMLPIWVYALAGATLGLNLIRLAAVMGAGSAVGTLVTFGLGRYFGDSPWVKRRFPNFHNHPWTTKKSKKYITLILFLGNASLIPCDIFYVACGFKRFPITLFFVATAAGRFVRYTYLAYLYSYFGEYIF